MKKINKLNQKLKKIEDLEGQIKSYKSLSRIPTIKFIMYKHEKNKKKNICKEIENIKRFAKGVELLYKYETENWIKDPNINCRMYNKLEAKARYRRNLKLYKLGFIKEKPKSTLFQKMQKVIPKFNLSENNFIKKIQSNFKNFYSNLLPNNTNKIAVSTAKKIIKGYRDIQAGYKFVANNLLQNESIKYFKSVVNEARIELKNEAKLENNVSTCEEEGRRFRERLRFDPQKNIKVYTANNKINGKSITVKSKNIAMEYDL